MRSCRFGSTLRFAGLQKEAVMMPSRSIVRSILLTGFLVGYTPIVAQADVRVWTDKEEVILKGTLKGIEVLPGGASGKRVKGLPAAPKTKMLPPKPALRPVTREMDSADGKLTVGDLVRKMPPGSTLILKKGRYFGGTVNRPVTITCRPGAEITGAGKKAALRIDASPVVIDGCTLRDSRTVMNSAGIWAEPKMKVLTVRNSRIINNGNGILIGEGVGRSLTVENTMFEGNGSRGRAHQIYVSGTDTKLVIRGGTFRNTVGDGHVIKTGAHTTLIENTRILGSAKSYSRAIDAFAGGVLLLGNVRIEHGPDANGDIIGFGAEMQRRRNKVQNRVLFSNVSVKCLRRNGCQFIQTWLPGSISTSGVSVAGGRVNLTPGRK